MSKLSFQIQGMHCKSCELLIEQRVKKVPGVIKANANFHTGQLTINYEDVQPDSRQIAVAVQAAGYQLGATDSSGTSGRSFWSRRRGDYIELILVAGFLLALGVILRSWGIADWQISAGDRPSLLTVLLLGLVAGVSTCMALVGGLVLGLSARHAELYPGATALQKFRPHLFFNLGRIAGYAVLGGLIGLLGRALNLSSSVWGLLLLILGLVMIMLGLNLTEVVPGLRRFTPHLPKRLSRLLGWREGVEYGHARSLLIGALTFFLPCGFTQAMQLYAMSTGSAVTGGLIMGSFALGTAPGLLGIGGLSAVAKGQWGRYFFKLAGLVVILLGLINLRGGWTLVGPKLSAWSANLGSTSAPVSGALNQDGVQEIKMEQVANGYRPSQFTIKRGIPVRWIVNSTYGYSCASFLVVPTLGISQPLKSGENVIEFTPTVAGRINFSCAMGMYRGVINVVN